MDYLLVNESHYESFNYDNVYNESCDESKYNYFVDYFMDYHLFDVTLDESKYNDNLVYKSFNDYNLDNNLVNESYYESVYESVNYYNMDYESVN
jgi:hypothetical protein